MLTPTSHVPRFSSPNMSPAPWRNTSRNQPIWKVVNLALHPWNRPKPKRKERIVSLAHYLSGVKRFSPCSFYWVFVQLAFDEKRINSRFSCWIETSSPIAKSQVKTATKPKKIEETKVTEKQFGNLTNLSPPTYSNHTQDVIHTVDGKKSAPVDMVNISWFTGFHTCWVVVWDFFHQQ